jgi:hypothetical protein
MDPKNKETDVTYWHPAFYADIQIELKDVPYINSIPIDELTITFISEKYPRKLLRHLKDIKQHEIEMAEPGIYYIKGDVIQIQIIVTRKLSEIENLWLRSLTNKLKKTKNAKKLIENYRKHSDNNLYKSVLETIMRANQKTFEQVNGMSDIFMEIVQEKFDRKLKEETEKAVEQTIGKAVEKAQKETELLLRKNYMTERISLIQKKYAKKKPLSVIADELETESEEIRFIYNAISENPEKTADEIFDLVDKTPSVKKSNS